MNVLTLRIAAAPSDLRLERIETTLALIRDYNDDFLSIVAWSLTAIVALSVLLLGFNWFQSNRGLKRDFDALRAELVSAEDARQASASAALTANVAKAVENAISSHVRAVASVEHRVTYLECKAVEAEAERWLQAKVHSNAVRAAAKHLEKTLELGWEWKTAQAIDLLDTCISALEVNNQKLDADDLSQVEAALARLGSEHKTARSTLLSKLHRVQAK